MRFKKVFLLPIVLLGLTSCGGSNPDPGPQPEPEPPVVVEHTLSFFGDNCKMKDADGNDITTVKVNDGDSKSYRISVDSSLSEEYVLPSQVEVEGTYETYKYNNTNGLFSIDKITSDVTIHASARKKDEYTITYKNNPGFEWVGKNPTTIKKGTKLSVGLKAIGDYTLDAAHIFIAIDTIGILDSSKYSYTNNTLTLSGQYVVGDITIEPMPIPPTPPTPTTHKVKFEGGDHLVATTMPESFSTGELYYYGDFVVKVADRDKYRLPIHTGDIKCDEFKIYRTNEAETVKMLLEPNEEYYYGTKFDDEYQVDYFYFIIRLSAIHSSTDEFLIETKATEQVHVTFDPGEGHWEEGGTDSKIGVCDLGMTLDDAARSCGANKTPTIGTAGMRFAGWFKTDGTKVESQTSIIEDLDLHAEYEEINYWISGEIINATKNLPETVHYHQGFSGTITANPGYTLPDKDNITVKMGLLDPEIITNKVTYNFTDATKTVANFSVPDNIVEDNIYIYITAYKSITVTFSPGEGYWRRSKTSETRAASVVSGATYNDAYSMIGAGGSPMKDGEYLFDGWYNGNVKITDMNAKVNTSVDLVAKYTKEGNTFKTDSWAHIVQYANEGLDSLYDHYGTTFFLDARRTLRYQEPYSNGDIIDYEVRLIDYNSHDTIAGTSGKKATLTFEFVNLIGTGQYGKIPGTYTGNNNWENSTYRSFLSDFYGVLTNPTLNLNPGFAAKQVVKKTSCVKVDEQGNPTWTVEDSNEYLFPLSGSEIGISGKNHATNPVTYNAEEGLMYDYYWYDSSATHNRMAKKYLVSQEETTDEYWLRSPHTVSEAVGHEGEADTTGSYFIHYENHYLEPQYYGIDFARNTADYPKGYMAAFCI